jgi:hypothetical protein
MKIKLVLIGHLISIFLFSQYGKPTVSIKQVYDRCQYSLEKIGKWRAVSMTNSFSRFTRFRLGRGSYLALSVQDLAVIKLYEGSVVDLNSIRYNQDMNKYNISFKSYTGKLRGYVEKGNPIILLIETLTGMISVTGTDFLLDIDTTTVHVLQGEVKLQSLDFAKRSVMVTAGNHSTLNVYGYPDEPSPITMLTYEEWNIPVPVTTEKHADFITYNDTPKEVTPEKESPTIVPVQSNTVAEPKQNEKKEPEKKPEKEKK